MHTHSDAEFTGKTLLGIYAFLLTGWRSEDPELCRKASFVFGQVSRWPEFDLTTPEVSGDLSVRFVHRLVSLVPRVNEVEVLGLGLGLSWQRHR
jgi:hypothetical protein